MKDVSKRMADMPAEEELIELLLDFIMVSASLTKKITRAIRKKEGTTCHGQNEGYAECHGGASQYGRHA